MKDPRRRACWVALAIVAVGCTGAPRPVTVAPPMRAGDPRVDPTEVRALLLLLADRGIYEPVTVQLAMDGDADVRRELALALGRVGRGEGVPSLGLLAGDPEARVRRAAVFSLGEIGKAGDDTVRASLFAALADPDREVGSLAVEALAKARAPLADVAARLVDAPASELLARLVPALFRFRKAGAPEAAVLAWAEQGLESGDGGVRRMAAYALGREPFAAAAPALRGLLADPDPWIRDWAARGLGLVGGRDDLPLLRPLLDDSAPGPIIQALRAVRRWTADGRVAAPAAWLPRILELLDDPRPGVRLTAIEASAVWLLDDALSRALAAKAGSAVRRERELAVVALAEGQDPQAPILVAELARSNDPRLRARAAEAAALIGALPILEKLAADPVPGVRLAALDPLLEGTDVADADAWGRAALADDDPAVRAAGLGWAEENPRLPMELLLAAMAPAWRDRQNDARLAGVDALRARALAEPLERGAIVERLEGLATDSDTLVRRRVAAALVALERPTIDPGGFDTRRSSEVYRAIVERTRASRFVDLLTDKGSLRIEVDCREAPLTALNFLQLAGQGFYDGLELHRVVPDFVVQMGDPRGDGWGGPGYAIRDEPGLLRFDRRGVVGMAHSGPDSAGSQLFITLSAQPHLDGDYTVFGRVVAGDEVLDALVQGDRVLRAVVFEEAVPAP